MYLVVLQADIYFISINWRVSWADIAYKVTVYKGKGY